MSKLSILGALLFGLGVAPLGCELVTGDVSHDFAGAGGTSAEAGDAGDTSRGGSVAGSNQGGHGNAGGPAESGASGAGDSARVSGDSGAAGMPGGCTPVSDGNPCTDDACVNGSPANPPSASGTACTGTGKLCDGAGACVACLAPSDCPGTDSACQTRTCNQGTCGFNFVAKDTLLPTQTAGDCRQARCDGAGAVTQAVDDTDLPNDSNVCTTDTCSNGSPSNPAKPTGTVCGTNLLCSATGVCVGCNVAADCGTSDECKTRTCTNNQCGVTFTTAGTAVAAQTSNNCLKATCDGSGNVSNIADGTDLPLDDGNACTDETCVQGAPQHPAKGNNTPCSDNNACTTGDTCQSGTCSSGTPVICTALDECHSAGTCNTSTGQCSNPTVAAGTPTTTGAGAQTAGDCHQKQCDVSGNIANVVDNSDVPADDGNQCTSEACSAGTPAHPPKALNDPCSTGGGTYCSAAGACVVCNVPSQCPGTDTECQTRTCTGNSCGFDYTPGGTATSAQTPGDCKQNECDGSGHIVAANHDADVPADDGNECTSDTCSGGVTAHPNLAPGSACSSGRVCNGTPACVALSVVSASPDDSTSAQDDASIVVTFNVPMAPATLTGQTVVGPCTGSIQVSPDDFTTCVAFSSAAAVMSAANATATLVPSPALLPATSYKLRVTTDAQSAGNVPLPTQFTQPNGFITQ